MLNNIDEFSNATEAIQALGVTMNMTKEEYITWGGSDQHMKAVGQMLQGSILSLNDNTTQFTGFSHVTHKSW